MPYLKKVKKKNTNFDYLTVKLILSAAILLNIRFENLKIYYILFNIQLKLDQVRRDNHA